MTTIKGKMINVRPDVHKGLKDCKFYAGESFSEVISRLIKFYKDKYNEVHVPAFAKKSESTVILDDSLGLSQDKPFRHVSGN